MDEDRPVKKSSRRATSSASSDVDAFWMRSSRFAAMVAAGDWPCDDVGRDPAPWESGRRRREVESPIRLSTSSAFEYSFSFEPSCLILSFNRDTASFSRCERGEAEDFCAPGLQNKYK